MTLTSRTNALERALVADQPLRPVARRLVGQTNGAIVLAGWCRRGKTALHWLAASSAIRAVTADEPSLWAAYAAFLLPPFTRDTLVLTNILCGLTENVDLWRDNAIDESQSRLLSRLLGPFLCHCVTQGPLVAEQAIDAIHELPAVARSQWHPDCVDVLRNAAVDAIAAARHEAVRVDLQAAADLLSAISVTPIWRSHWSPILRGAIAQRTASLQGRNPRDLAAAALDPLDAYIAGAALTLCGAPLMQRVRVRRQGQRKVHEREVLSISEAWSAVFHQWMRGRLQAWSPSRPPAAWSPVGLRPAGSRLGSFELYWMVESSVAGREAELVAAASELGIPSGDVDDGSVTSWRRLFQVIAGQGATVEVTHYHGAASWSVTIDRETLRTAQPQLPIRRQPRVPSLLIPQANNLTRLYLLIDLIHGGDEVSADSLDVDARQVDYYFLAAVAVGLLAPDRSLTSAGRQVARTSIEAQRHALMAVLLETSVVGDAWIVWSGVSNLAEVEPGSARDFVAACGQGLSGSTIPRRASTLERWARTLAPHHYCRVVAGAGRRG